MARHFTYAVELAASPERIYRVATDTARWRRSRVYRDIRWTQGEPWQKDSVRVVETEVPFYSRHRQRVTGAVPGERFGVLSHGLGYTMQLEVALRPSARGGTEVQYTMDVFGTLPLLLGFMIDDFVRKFMTVYMAELERLVAEDKAA